MRPMKVCLSWKAARRVVRIDQRLFIVLLTPHTDCDSVFSLNKSGTRAVNAVFLFLHAFNGGDDSLKYNTFGEYRQPSFAVVESSLSYSKPTTH